MTFVVSTSAYGTHHQSKAEAKAAERWLPLGIIAHDEPLPVPFFDKKGERCEGRADFLDDAFGFLIECKGDHLNNKTAKVFAERGMARHREKLDLGIIKPKSKADRWGVLENGWNHAAAQIAAKQEACHEAGFIHLVIFTEEPDADTLELLTKYGILWLQEGTREFNLFNFYRTMARHGVGVRSVPIKDCLITFGEPLSASVLH